MSDSSEQEMVEQVATEARKNYDLSARLKNRSRRTRKVVVYTDEVAAEQVKDYKRKMEQLSEIAPNLEVIADLTKTLGLPDEAYKYLHALSEAAVTDLDAYKALEEKYEEALAEVRSSALEFELQGLPEIVLKDARRIARKDLNLKGAIPEDRSEEFIEYNGAVVISKSVTRFTDRESGYTSEKLSPQDALALSGDLPAGEFTKLGKALQDLNFEAVVSQVVTDDVDF